MKIEVDLSRVPKWRRDAIISELYSIADGAGMDKTLTQRLTEAIPSDKDTCSPEYIAQKQRDAIQTHLEEGEFVDALTYLIEQHTDSLRKEFYADLRELLCQVFELPQ